MGRLYAGRESFDKQAAFCICGRSGIHYHRMAPRRPCL